MRLSVFPRFHHRRFLCKQPLLFFGNRTKNAFFRPEKPPQDRGIRTKNPPASCVKRKSPSFFLTACPQGFNIHFTQGPAASLTLPVKKKTLCFSPFLWYTSGKTREIPACFHKRDKSGAGFSPRVWNEYLYEKFVEQLFGGFTMREDICSIPVNDVFLPKEGCPSAACGTCWRTGWPPTSPAPP